jgi:hypothetical protein
VIDNLSALLESPAAGSRNSGALDNLLAFLSQDYPSFNGIHFLLSWKLTPKTKPGLEELEDALHRHGGRALKLGPMAEQGIEGWLSNEFPWFRDLGDAQAAERYQAERRSASGCLRVAGGGHRFR